MKKIFALLLCSTLFLLPTGCQETEGEGNSQAQGSYVNLESFDSYETVDYIWWNTKIGDAVISNEKVTEGTGALTCTVVDPVVMKDQLGASTLYVPTLQADKDYRDFSMIDEVALDVYGEAGTDLSVGISAVFKGKTVVSGPSKVFTIEAGKWNTLYFPVNRTVTDASIDITRITHIQLNLSGTNAVLTLDNLRLHKAISPFVSADFTVDKGEICDFEKAYQSFAVTAATVSGVQPQISVQSNPEWSTSGARSLKIVSPAMEDNVYFQLEFSERLFKAADFNMYPAGGYLAYDVYKPFARSWWYTVRIRNSGTGAYDNVSVTVPEGAGWHTVCIPLTRRVTDTTNVQILWQSKSGLGNGGKEDTVFYIDNVRLIESVPTKGSVFVAEE